MICKYLRDEVCVNADSEMCADFPTGHYCTHCKLFSPAEIHPDVTDKLKNEAAGDALAVLAPYIGIKRLVINTRLMHVTINKTIYVVSTYGLSPKGIAMQIVDLLKTGTCDDLVSVKEVRGKKI